MISAGEEREKFRTRQEVKRGLVPKRLRAEKLREAVLRTDLTHLEKDTVMSTVKRLPPPCLGAGTF